MIARSLPAFRLSDSLAALWRPMLPLAVLLGGNYALARLGIDPAGALAVLVLRHRDIAELAFLPAGAALCFLGVPRQVVAYAAGTGFGLWAGTLLAVAATTLGCAASFAWARLAARAWVQPRLQGRAAGVDRFLAAHPFSVTLMLRLLPVGNNLLLTLAAGVSAVAAGPFLLGSAVGYVPQSLVFALLGAGMQVGQGLLLGVAAGLLVVCSAIGLWLRRRLRDGYGFGAPPEGETGGEAA
jgi:uncharacterized membrane protein YdjX (TVP38/TMEM64 family)